MSGGHFDYNEQSLAQSMFGWSVGVDYGDEGHKMSPVARRINPMKDRELSELVFDVLCLIHCCDYVHAGDICDETYDEDKQWFKKKWLKRTGDDALKAYRADLKAYFDELMKEMGEGDAVPTEEAPADSC